ncbi:YgaP family membrane protein [Stutzerimonas stutzeri]
MKSNIGTLDRALRIIVGLVLIGLTLAGVIGLWGWIGLLPIATGVFRFCPAYRLLGISSCKLRG